MKDDFVPDLLEIDLFHLDWEWSSQPKLYHELADQLVKAEDTLRYWELELEVNEAEIELEIRRTGAANYGLDKLTEGTIRSLIVVNPVYMKCQEKVIQKQNEVAELKVKVRTADHRKTALENIVVLQGRDTYAEPKMPKHKDQNFRSMVNKPVSRKEN